MEPPIIDGSAHAPARGRWALGSYAASPSSSHDCRFLIFSGMSFRCERQEAEEGSLGRSMRVTAVVVAIGSMMGAHTEGGSPAADVAGVAKTGGKRRGDPGLKTGVGPVI